MKKIVGFEKIYGERFQIMDIKWEVQSAGQNPNYTPFSLKIVDTGEWKDIIDDKIVSCFLDFHGAPTLEFWCDRVHLHTMMLKPSGYKTKMAFLQTIVGGMLSLESSGLLKSALLF
jgi:hypothetical protein